MEGWEGGGGIGLDDPPDAMFDERKELELELEVCIAGLYRRTQVVKTAF